MKRTNFSLRFDKPDLNFQKVYTHSQSSGDIKHHNPRQNCIRLYFSTLQETRQVQQEAQLSPMDRATRLSVETVRDVRLIAFDKSCNRRMQPVRPVECGF